MLKGKKIVLRPLQESDLDFLERIENNKENWQFGSEKKQFNKKELLDYIANAKTDIKVAKQYRFVIDLHRTPIGFIDLFDYTIDSAGVGVIISKDHRNKGFAKEALNLISHYGFNILKLQKLYCSIVQDNLFSTKLFTSCRFDLEKETNNLQYFVKFANS
jgi:diamine N-acetyltransferase